MNHPRRTAAELASDSRFEPSRPRSTVHSQPRVHLCHRVACAQGLGALCSLWVETCKFAELQGRCTLRHTMVFNRPLIDHPIHKKEGRLSF